MGGLPCRKAAIDGGAGAVMVAEKNLAALRRAVQCMSATITMGGENDVTEEEEDAIVGAFNVFGDEIKTSFERVIAACSELEGLVRKKSET